MTRIEKEARIEPSPRWIKVMAGARLRRDERLSALTAEGARAEIERDYDNALDRILEAMDAAEQTTPRRVTERAIVRLPAGLDPGVAARVNELVGAAVASGWMIGPVDWVSRAGKTVSFAAKPPLGKPIFVLCEEAGLVAKMQTVLGGVTESS